MKLLLLITSLWISGRPSKPLPALHYFYNSGWMIETSKHAILIDFIPHQASGSTFDRVKQMLQQAAARNKKILVMVTHDHQDHFDPAVLQLHNDVPGITYILGWNYQAATGTSIHTLLPGDSLIQPAYNVYTHTSTDEGVGFLLEIDGLSIYHAGDHALWAEQILQLFTDELKAIRGKTKQIDLAFIPAARGMFTKCAYDSVIGKGIQLSLDILQPTAIALQHVGCEEKLSTYQQAYMNLNLPKDRRVWVLPSRYNQAFPSKAN
ncbi:MAG TPA: MBL fold metallo-hydrolase [Chitinophagaceae bacterium]|nr:MBL fold metallo-hydrolase [Chitinophagaceae bacterium]